MSQQARKLRIGFDAGIFGRAPHLDPCTKLGPPLSGSIMDRHCGRPHHINGFCGASDVVRFHSFSHTLFAQHKINRCRITTSIHGHIAC